MFFVKMSTQQNPPTVKSGMLNFFIGNICSLGIENLIVIKLPKSESTLVGRVVSVELYLAIQGGFSTNEKGISFLWIEIKEKIQEINLTDNHVSNNTSIEFINEDLGNTEKVECKKGRSAACIHGDCLVQTPAGLIPMCLLKPGDRIYVNGTVPFVATVSRIVMSKSYFGYKVADGVILSGYHPYLNESGKRCFAAETYIDVIETFYEMSFYSVMLSNDARLNSDVHMTDILVQNTPVAVMGHGITDASIDPIGHPFWGSCKRIVDALSNLDKTLEGLYVLNEVLRDDDGNVIGFA